jgi:hypothetical protein
VETPTFFILGAQHRAVINNRVAVQAAAKTSQNVPFYLSLSLFLLSSLCLLPHGESCSRSGILSEVVHRRRLYRRILIVATCHPLRHSFCSRGRPENDALSGAAMARALDRRGTIYISF